MTLSTRRARLLVCAALAAPALLLCGPALFGGRQLFGKDFQPGYAPLYDFARLARQESGELPRWHPGHFAGIPFLGNPQTDLFYPPNWAYLVAPATAVYGWLTALHLLIASAGMYRLMRGFGTGRVAALLSGLSYALSFAVIGRINAGHYPYFVTVCQAPALLHLARLAIDKPGGLHVAGLAAAVAAALLGGSPQFIFHLALLSTGFVAWRIAARVRAGAEWKRPLASVAFASTIGLLVSLVHVLPALEVAGDSSRGSGDLRGLTESFSDFSPATLVGFFVPRFHWKAEADLWLWHEKGLYTGLLPLFLAGAALALNRRGPVLFFAATALVALLTAALPGFSRFRVPERILWIAVLSVSALAAFGWEALRQVDPGRRRRVLISAGALVLAVAAALLLGPRAPVEAGLFVVTAAACVVALRAPGEVAAVLALLLATADAGGHGFATLRFLPGSEILKPPWYESRIGPEREQYRVLDLTDYWAGASLRGFRLLRCGGYPIPARLSEVYARAWVDPQPSLDTLPTGSVLKDPSLLRRLNVRWIITAGPPLHPDWRLLGRSGSGALYEDAAALPTGTLEGTEGSVTVTRPAPHRVRVDIDARGPGRLCLSEAWSPGWRASRNGEDLVIRALEGVLMGTDVPAGRGAIEFVYAPRTWTAGRILSGFGLLLLLGCLGFGLRARNAAGP